MTRRIVLLVPVMVAPATRWKTVLLAATFVASIGLVGFTGSAVADTEVGVSGSCDDQSGDGPQDAFEGEGGTEVDTGDGVGDEVDDATTNPGGDQLANTGFIHFAIGEAQGHQDACDRDEASDSENKSGDDYLEAHVQVGNQDGVAFCQAEGHESSGHVHTDYDGNHHASQCQYDSQGNHDGAGSGDSNNNVQSRVDGTTP